MPFGYDEDGLLTQAGDLAVARSPVRWLIAVGRLGFRSEAKRETVRYG